MGRHPGAAAVSVVVIGITGEDDGHFNVVTRLIDDTLIAHHHWLDGIVDSCRSWRGLHTGESWYKYDPDDAKDVRAITVDGLRIRPHGHINGRPLEPEAGMWRKVLLLFLREPRPDAVVLARDMDGYLRRRAGMSQVRDGIPWPFKVVIAAAEPEVEAWLVAGFVANGPDEEERLKDVRKVLSFDPTTQSHRLTSHPNDAPTDAKRVLFALCQDDEDRIAACLADRRLLAERGANNGLNQLLDEIEQQIVPIFSDQSP